MKTLALVVLRIALIIVLFTNNVIYARDKGELLAAVEELNLQKVKQMLADGANPNGDSYNRLNGTPLVTAIIKGNQLMVELLLAGGADVNLTVEGNYPLAFAAMWKQWAIYDYLLSQSVNEASKEDALANIVWQGDAKRLQDLLDNGVSVDSADAVGGETALMMASRYGHVEIVNMLLDRGATVNKISFGRGIPTPNTALSVSLAYPEIVMELVQHGADVNVLVGRQKSTALLMAASKGYLPTVKILIEAGADTGFQDKTGNTALSLAEKYGHLEIAEYLKGVIGKQN